MQHSVEKEEDQDDRNIYFSAANKNEAANYIILCSREKTATWSVAIMQTLPR